MTYEQLYIDNTLLLLTSTGCGTRYLGNAGHYFVGLSEEDRDLAMIIRQNSLENFLSFRTIADYLKGVGHRTVSLSDSRILLLSPLVGSDIP